MDHKQTDDPTRPGARLPHIEQAFDGGGLPTPKQDPQKEDLTRTRTKEEDMITRGKDEMRTFAVYDRGGQETTTEADAVINEDGWWGKSFVLYIGRGYDPLVAVVEADNEGDAIDEFIDSRWAFHLTEGVEPCSACDDEHYDDCNCSFGGNYGLRYDAERLAFMARCKTVKAPTGWDPKQWALMKLLGAPPVAAPASGSNADYAVL